LVGAQGRPGLEDAPRHVVLHDARALAAASEHLVDDLLLGGAQFDGGVARSVGDRRNGASVGPANHVRALNVVPGTGGQRHDILMAEQHVGERLDLLQARAVTRLGGDRLHDIAAVKRRGACRQSVR
jgi:hypothetical protein